MSDSQDELAILRAEIDQAIPMAREVYPLLFAEYSTAQECGFTRAEAMTILLAKYFPRPLS